MRVLAQLNSRHYRHAYGISILNVKANKVNYAVEGMLIFSYSRLDHRNNATTRVGFTYHIDIESINIKYWL